ncbi:MAG TPA: hypothetical protein VI452_01395 [Marmoricola sp.]
MTDEPVSRAQRAQRRLRAAAGARERSEHTPVLTRSEALLLASDFFMAGLIDEAPTLYWQPEDLARALLPWGARVVPDPPGDAGAPRRGQPGG